MCLRRQRDSHSTLIRLKCGAVIISCLVAAKDAKVCFSDDTLPDGFRVRKGDVICYLPYAMGRMKFIWGDDAEVFRPERWLDEDGRFQPESTFKFTAFQVSFFYQRFKRLY